MLDSGPVARLLVGRFLRLLMVSPFSKQLPGLRGANDPGDRLRVLRELLEAGQVTPVIDRTFTLSEVPARFAT
jgi:NADPH:quinone reductase-like Zn-dependent oxidoreductase